MQRDENIVHDLARRFATGAITINEYRLLVEDLLRDAPTTSSGSPKPASPAAERIRSAETTIEEYLKRVGELLRSEPDDPGAPPPGADEASSVTEERIKSAARKARSFS